MVRRILTYLAIFAAAIVGIALVLNFAMAILVGGRQVDVPDIRGLSEKDAVNALHRIGLKAERQGTEFSIDCAESLVVMQEPPGGRTVKQGRKVFMTLSRGPEFRDVPYCEGKTLRSAEIFLEKAGFTVGTVAVASKRGAYPDQVISTDPSPGSQAVRGSVVNILASSGSPRTRYILPDLKGKHYLPVRLQLERLGMLVRESGSEKDLRSSKSRVLMQEPPPGFIISRGDTVILSVSSKYGGRIEL